MALLIDGYNLLHVTGIFGRGIGPGSLERSRRALLNVLVASLSSKELRDATIVFDAEAAPPGLPRTVDHDGLTVRYASGYADADTLIEELIDVHSSPRNLTVVSSDHRIQRAARRRKAKAVDSDVWYGELLRQRRQRGEVLPSESAKPDRAPSKSEVEYWLKEFGEKGPGSGKGGTDEDEDNPFPPGYGEDLLDE